MLNNNSDSTMFRGNMKEDDDPFDQMRNVYEPSLPTYMDEIVYYVSDGKDLYGYIEDGGVNLLIANNYTNVSDMFTYQGMIFLVDEGSVYVIKLEEGFYSE